MLVQSGDGLKVKKEEGFGKDTLRNSSLDEWGPEVPLTEVRHPQGEQRRVWGKQWFGAYSSGSACRLQNKGAGP